VYRSTGAINFYGQNGIDLSFGTKEDTDYWEVSSGTPILTAPRVYDVRQPYRVPMLLNMAGYDKLTLLVSDIDVTTSSDRLAELDLAVDRFFELGIEDTDRQNTLIHHIRCAGRGEEGWPTFYASEDTLLYEACCDIVHGARGIHLRALDFALMCGNGGSSVPVGVFRAPDLLLNWAPSIETTNTDMISRIHSVIETLSGPGTDPDIFSILVDDSYTALDTNYVMNAEFIPGTGWRQDDDPWLNFIALEKTCAADSIEIVLLVVNDYETYADGIIRFPEYDEDDCTLEYIAGFELIYSLRSETMLALDFGLMPAYTASLYRITYEP
jgi:hypothetical protein